MSVMVAPEFRPFTRADLASMPEDGRRYEIIDGVLVVSASPGRVHQRAVVRLLARLCDACPQAYEVLPGPFERVIARPEEAVLVVWELDDGGSYRQVARVVGEEPLTAGRPFPVTIVPADLVR